MIKRKDRKIQILIISIVIVVTILFSMLKKEINYQELSQIDGATLAIYNEETRIESIPEKDSKLYFDKI